MFAFTVCSLLLVDEDDLRDVRSAVVHLAGRWKDLGISLGIHSSKLDAFDSHSTSDCLREILTLWLRQSYNVRTVTLFITLSTLVWCEGWRNLLCQNISSLKLAHINNL